MTEEHNRIDILQMELDRNAPHWLTPSERDPDGSKRRRARAVRKLIRAALRFAAMIAALSSMAFVFGLLLPPKATLAAITAIKGAAVIAAPAGIVLDITLGGVAALIAIRKWRNRR